jgi:hypothetical protein
MTAQNFIKISSRAGRFKKKLVGIETLRLEAPSIMAALSPLVELHRQKSITDTEFCASYVLLYLSQRFPKTWLGAKRKSFGLSHQMNFPVRKLPLKFEEKVIQRLPETIGEVFDQFALKSTPETVNRALLSWSYSSYPLVLLFHIPRPGEVLAQQKEGKRCVTVLTKDLDQFVLGERDPLSFTMHDLIHADHFYFDNHCYEGQISLYWFLDYCLKRGLFDELWKNEEFRKEIDYLISDMNAYAVHSMKCLKAALEFYHPGKKEFAQQWISQLPGENQYFLKLQTPEYQDVCHDAELLRWLSSFRVK